MAKSKFMGRLLQSTIFVGAMAAAAPALAQDDESDTIVVTGTRIQRAQNLVGTSPVTEIGAQEFDERGVLRVEDVVNTLPQAFGAQSVQVSNGATGTASLNLRGLGSNRTLTLVNGRRLPYGSTTIAAPDVNFVPAQLIERVDVLTGGASATYGSDAIAGVVNFILNDDFEGFRIDGNWSTYQHTNDNDELQGLLSDFAAGNPTQFRVPDGSTWGGEAVDVTALFGGDIDGGRGHITAYVGYQNQNEIRQDSRDYSQCAFGAAGDEFTCSGSATNQFTNFLDVGGGFGEPFANGLAALDETTGDIVAYDGTTDTFNFNPFNFFIRPSERYQFGAFADYELAEGLEFYSELMFMDNRTNAQIAPSGVFGGGVAGQSGGINCDNPFLSDQAVDVLCTAQGLSAEDGDVAEGVIFLRRNVEGGPRNNDLRHTTYRGVVGLRGDIGDTGLAWDVSGQYANVHRAETYNNELSIQNVSRALNAVTNDDGDIVCAVNADDNVANDDPNCAPYDIFSPAGPSEAALGYIGQPLILDGQIEQVVVQALINGELGEVGLTSPLATAPAAFALGVEYRRDRLSSEPSSNYISGDGFGQGGPTLPIEGAQDVYEIFGELNVPLIQDRPFIDQFGLDLAYRYSSYTNSSEGTRDTSFDTESYKAGFDYAPSADIRFRGSYQRAVRAPNIFELFSNQQVALFDLTADDAGRYDPCATSDPAATPEQCARTGVTADQYGNIADNPAGQFNQFIGGNPNLQPETSDTFTIGAVIEPGFLDRFSLSVDYFDIQVEDFVDQVSPNLSLQQCLETGSEFFCGLVNRGDGGTLFANPTGFITATDVNTGEISTSGIDVLSRWTFPVAEQGDVTMDFVGTWVESLETLPLPGLEEQRYDCVGLYGGACGTPNPEWRHKLSFRWDTGLNLGLTAAWRYYDAVDVVQSDESQQAVFGSSFAPVNETLDSQNYIDVSARYELSEMATLRAGVNNVFDKEPPLSSVVGAGLGNGNTYPTVYDSLGRYIFIGGTIDF